MSADEPGWQPSPRLVRAIHHPLVLAPVRLLLSALILVATFVAGAGLSTGLLAWALGAFLAFFVLSTDRRFLLLERREPTRVPAGATVEGWWRVLAADIFPSTVGISGLAAAALAFTPALAALLAGILGGMGLASVLGCLRLIAAERTTQTRFYYERGSWLRFFEPRG